MAQTDQKLTGKKCKTVRTQTTVKLDSKLPEKSFGTTTLQSWSVQLFLLPSVLSESHIENNFF